MTYNTKFKISFEIFNYFFLLLAIYKLHYSFMVTRDVINQDWTGLVATAQCNTLHVAGPAAAQRSLWASVGTDNVRIFLE